jgi:hypothetical protein
MEAEMIQLRPGVLLGVVLACGLFVACGSSSSPRRSDGTDLPQIQNAELKVGDLAPSFRLPDHTGGYVELSDYRGKQNVIVAFYPAAFTPV